MDWTPIDRLGLLLPDPNEPPFEQQFQTFVEGGGLDRVGSVSEDYELMYRGMDRHVPEFCPHGFTKVRCGECNFSQEQRW